MLIVLPDPRPGDAEALPPDRSERRNGQSLILPKAGDAVVRAA